MEKAHTFQSPEILYGSLFEAIQMGGIFPDSKTFTDCSPKNSVAEIKKAYENVKNQADFDLKSFVVEHFSLPIDHASTFQSDTSKLLGEHIASLWPILTRQADDMEAEGTLIPLPHPYVVPGGRFGEIYYWDSYFTQIGLRAAGKIDLIRQMVDNFAYLIDTIGYIPNGNRTYFLGRSQPPFFSLMVAMLSELELQAGIKDTFTRYLPQLDAEYAFWMQGAETLHEEGQAHRRVVLMENDVFLNRYWDDNPTPRPESFREDIETAHLSDTPNGPLYTHIRAACESGWDFSSRWGAAGTLKDIRTTEILPVDLNCLLWHLETVLSRAYIQEKDRELAIYFQETAAKRKAAIQSLFFDKRLEAFCDYDLTTKRTTSIISAAAVYPLFFKLHTFEQGKQVCAFIEKHLLRPGGIVTSPVHTGQQWDAPNGWAPLQWMAFVGARNAGRADLAETIRVRWLELVTKVYKKTGKMLEKYNVQDLSLEAGGGEYPVQDGFGWTNGVTLAFYNMEV